MKAGADIAPRKCEGMSVSKANDALKTFLAVVLRRLPCFRTCCMWCGA